MNYATAKERVLFLANSRLKERPLDYQDLVQEIENPATNKYWQVNLCLLPMSEKLNNLFLSETLAAHDNTFLRLIDTWAQKRPPRTIASLPANLDEAPEQSPATLTNPVAANPKKWTPEKLAELKA